MVGTATDITGRRETPLHLFVEQAPAALALLDRHMRYVAVSERWQADLGLSGQDLRGRGHYEIFPSTGEAIRNAHRRCLAGAIDDATDESSIACADGRTRWIRLTARPWRDASGDIDGLLMGAEDVTDRVRARQLEADCADWRLTAERFRLALRGSPVSVFEQDLDLRFMWVHNPDPAIGMGANGLIGMRERAESSGGSFAIQSSPGAGTRVTATLPVVTEPIAPRFLSEAP